MSEPSESQRANLELFGRAFAAFGSGDTAGLLAVADPDIEIYVPPELANSGTYREHDEFITWMGRWLEAWEDYELEMKDVEPVGEHHVVSLMSQTATGVGSGVPVEMDIAYMADVRDGKVVALHLYPTRDEAMAVAKRREAGEPDARGGG